jgi:hypothetical protein
MSRLVVRGRATSVLLDVSLYRVLVWPGHFLRTWFDYRQYADGRATSMNVNERKIS